MSDWKECRNYENCGCYCIYPDEFEAGLCGNCLEEHNEDERAAELERLRAELAASREREARMRAQRFELLGVITDVEQGDGFDDVCLRTLKRVAGVLAEGAQG